MELTNRVFDEFVSWMRVLGGERGRQLVVRE